MSDTAEQQPPPAAVPGPVRVAWVAGRDTLDQLGHVLLPLAIGLMDELVELVAIAPAAPDAPPPPALPFEVLPCPPTRWWHLREGAVEALAEELRKRKVQLVHGLDASAAALAARLTRRRQLACVHSSYALGDAARLRKPARRCAALLAASEPIRQELLAHAGAPLDRVQLLRPGVHSVRRPTCFNHPGHSVAIVAGGTFAEAAPFQAVLRCFAELTARGFDCEYFLIGRGRAERALRRQAAELKLDGHLTFADCRRFGQLTGIFKAADVYVAPVAQREIDMRSLLAIAAGVPVLAATGRGASDFHHDGETIMSFAPCDSAELTVKLAALLDDRASARDMAAGALEYVREHHSPSGSASLLAGIYRRTAAEAARQRISVTKRETRNLSWPGSFFR